MDVTEITHSRSESPTAVSAPAAAEYAQCDECGAAVEHEQRYCVNCGAHRRHAPDPAARYLSRATARARSVTGPAGQAGSGPPSPGHGRRGGRGPGLVVALLLALIPAGVAVGVEVGRSSSNNDAQLIRELTASQAQLQAAAHAAGATTAPAAATASASATSSHAHKRRARHAHARKAAAASSPNPNTAKAPAKIDNSGSPAQQRQGAAIVNRLQHTNGTSYLNQLPSQAVVP